MNVTTQFDADTETRVISVDGEPRIYADEDSMAGLAIELVRRYYANDASRGEYEMDERDLRRLDQIMAGWSDFSALDLHSDVHDSYENYAIYVDNEPAFYYDPRHSSELVAELLRAFTSVNSQRVRVSFGMPRAGEQYGVNVVIDLLDEDSSRRRMLSRDEAVAFGEQHQRMIKQLLARAGYVVVDETQD